jgi:multiple PDZ domain protein
LDNEISQLKENDDIDSSNHLDTENLCLTLWGPPRSVILYRDEQVKNLGISIVGGKLDFSGPGNTIETCISGIFIKHVIPDSLAGRHSTLKTGDRILEVNGYNLRDATHDHAVEMIRSAQSPIYFIVQSLLDPSNQVSYEKQYEHLNGDVLLIDIKRNIEDVDEPLGFSLIGHRDPDKLAVFVCDIHSNSLIERDNRFQIGDQLLQVKIFICIILRIKSKFLDQ